MLTLKLDSWRGKGHILASLLDIWPAAWHLLCSARRLITVGNSAASLPTPLLILSVHSSCNPYSLVFYNSKQKGMLVACHFPETKTKWNHYQLHSIKKDMIWGEVFRNPIHAFPCLLCCHCQPHSEELMKAISGRKAVISPLLKGSLLNNMLIWERERIVHFSVTVIAFTQWLLYWNSWVVLLDLFQKAGQSVGRLAEKKTGYLAVVLYERLIIIWTDHLPGYNYISLSSVHLKYSKYSWRCAALRKMALRVTNQVQVNLGTCTQDHSDPLFVQLTLISVASKVALYPTLKV